MGKWRVTEKVGQGKYIREVGVREAVGTERNGKVRQIERERH